MDRTLRTAAFIAPLCLFGYGVFRYVDGRDGPHGPGTAWNVGHWLFLAAVASFGLIIICLWHGVRSPSVRRMVVANVATIVGLVGIVVFVRVVLGDLFPDHDDVLAAPGALQDAAPGLFLFGLLAMLIDLAIHEPHRLPAWSPVVIVLGFVTIMLGLDLLPVAGGLFFLGLAPLSRRSAVPSP